ncbi:hypothetical protein ACQBAU_06535 [Propionibacteriaceae bacterium Y2011]|uniref:hypothetical protein n=1 Tax=Microlunatus sp. Y2014 TaxID=3418488 RepID=UPI003B4E854E
MPSRRTVLALGAAGSVGLSLGPGLGPATTASARTRSGPPPVPGGTVTDHGSPMSSLTVVEGAFGLLPDGRIAAYAPAQGENSALNVSTVTDPAEQVGQYAMTGAGGGPTIVVAADQTVYVGTYNSGHLFRWDPATEQMTDVGTPTERSTFLYGLSAAPDGTVYGGTFPDAHAWSYHPDRGFTDLGRVSTTEAVQYAKSTAYDPDRHALYVGTRPVAELWKLDLASGEFTRLSPAAPFTGNELSDLDYAEGHVFACNTRQLRVFDAATDTEVDVIDAATGQLTRAYSITGRGASEARAGRIWFSTAGPEGTVLGHYDLATRVATATRHRTVAGSLIGYHWTTEDDHDVMYGFAGNYGAGAMRYDLQADTAKVYKFALSPAPSPLGNIVVSPDGSSVMINAFLNGNGVRRDVATGEITPIARLGQVEDWTWVDDPAGGDSIAYAGVYPSGSLKAYRPDQPTGDTNPRTLVELKAEPNAQIRPHDVQLHDGLLWAASEPDYGQRGGALTSVVPADGEATVTRPVVPDHTMAAFTFLDDRMFAGSSRNGGTGTTPVEGSAALVEFDPDARTVIRSVAPVDGARSVNAMLVHDGRLLGLADTTIFEVDLTSFEVTRTFPLPGVSGATGPGSGDLVIHPNGYLYAQAQGALFAVDPLSLQVAANLMSRVNRAPLSADGSLWTLLRPDGFSEPLHHAQFVPDSDTEPDNRWLVRIRDIVTPVANRFVETGVTLADLLAELFPAKGPTGTEAEVSTVLAELVATGVITPDERLELSRAARRAR